ncbi:hypothetical protein ACWGK6_36590 [Streptomyces violaceusniger]
MVTVGMWLDRIAHRRKAWVRRRVAACVPVVDIGLRAVGEGSFALGEVSEESGREVDLVAGLVDLLAGERAAVGQGVQAALDVPGGEELQQAPRPGGVDGGQFLGEPPLEQQQLPVGRGQDATLHEQVAQVGDRPPGCELAQSVVGERDFAAG